MEMRILSLTLHRLNTDSVELFQRFIIAHGGNWTSLPLWADGKYHICFPPETYYIKDERYGTRTTERYTVYLPDDYYIVWYKIKILETGKIQNTINIPRQD